MKCNQQASILSCPEGKFFARNSLALYAQSRRKNSVREFLSSKGRAFLLAVIMWDENLVLLSPNIQAPVSPEL